METVYFILVIFLIMLFMISFSLFARRLISNSNYRRYQLIKLQEEVDELKAQLATLQSK
uniref:DUF4083 family protein n=1 Tax=Chryseomicrobium sp. FSL W7-1435 TaxID=2921704 RepID=UPI00406D2F7D